eukprot:1157492-Pelagomonas_calceolata.AAC.9
MAGLVRPERMGKRETCAEGVGEEVSHVCALVRFNVHCRAGVAESGGEDNPCLRVRVCTCACECSKLEQQRFAQAHAGALENC